MQIIYKNKKLEKFILSVNVLAAAMVTASFICLFGFEEPLLPNWLLYTIQATLLFIFIGEKVFRCFNSYSKLDYLRNNWFEVPLLLILIILLYGSGKWFDQDNPVVLRHFAIGVYLVFQVVAKVCRTVVNLAATGQNPTQTLILSFLILIFVGAGLLMLPNSSAGKNVSFVDALFTSTSATCVTGLIVKDTGKDFSMMGQIVILTLIQLGGLGIVIFGAILALLLGQALTLRESVAMQDLLSSQTVSKIGNIIAFIFGATILIEAIGAVSLYHMWDNVPSFTGSMQEKWYFSIFHSVSAFCNAGFSLLKDSFIPYNKSAAIYTVICPLIILGGLGFTVLHDLTGFVTGRLVRFFKIKFQKCGRFQNQVPPKMKLQSKIVISVSLILIIVGTLTIYCFDQFSIEPNKDTTLLDSAFQSITARTAGFNTVDVRSMSPAGKFTIMLLMFIGGSPGSTAGGIKTVTLAVVVMTVIASLRKRQEVEIFKRSIRLAVVARAITVLLLFIAVLLVATLALGITERGIVEQGNTDYNMSDISFEAASALGTVGLSTGITPHLSDAGKIIIVLVMLIGRLGPLTLLAVLTFNIKPAKFNYPEEAIIVG